MVVFIFVGCSFLKGLFSSLPCQAKRKRAMLESNPPGINLTATEMSPFKGVFLTESSFAIFRAFHAFKNSSMNFFFRAIDNPLWFLNLFFKSAKCPSMALVVLGIFNSM